MDLIALAGSDSLTPKELYHIALARQKNEWDHTSMLASVIANLFVKKPRGPRAFHPFYKTESDKSGGATLAQFKAILGGGD